MRYSVKLLCAVLAGAILVPCAAHAADADYDGFSAPSQITAYIDDRPIPSYNIDGVAFVPLSILSDYGFTVMEEADGCRITDAQNAYAGGALPRDTEKAAHPYRISRTRVTLGEREAVAVEIDGGLALSMDDLAAAFATSYRWIPAADALRLDTRAEAEFPAVNGADGVNSRYRVTLEDGQIVFHYPDGHTASVADGTYPYCEDAFYVSDIASAAAVFDEEGLCLRVSTSHDEGATWTVAEISLSDLTPPDAEVRDFYLDIYPQSVWMGYTSEQAGWIVLTTYYGMANGKQILFRTDDGGMTWSRVHDSPWRRYAVGAGFATPERGWISLLMADDPLTVWYTDDGGATWSLYDLMQFVPASLRAGVMEAASPVFDGERGRWQVYVRRTDGYNTLEQYMLWLVTNDGGETWYCENPTEWVE